MHDDQLERRLRSALHDEADRMPFTITAAELERRAVLRGRYAGSRRLTLLLAATVAIGALAAGSLIGGLRNDQTPDPTAPIAADASVSPVVPPPSGPSTPAGPLLPGLDELLAVDRDKVLIAQAHGPADRPFEPGFDSPFPSGLTVDLGTVFGGSDYAVSVACLGASRDATLTLDVRTPGDRTTPGPTGPEVPCDGALVEHSARLRDSATVSLYLGEPASWRVVVRSTRGPTVLPLPTENPVLPVAGPDREELVRQDNATFDSGRPWGESGLLQLREVGVVPARWTYGALLWCPSGAVRVVFGDEIAGVVTPVTETHVACNGTTHDLYQGITSPHGSRVYVAAVPGARWSLLVTGDAPPISLPGAQPGWQETVAFGPNLSFDATPHAVVAPAPSSSGGPVRIAIACAGSLPLVVTVELGPEVGEQRDRFTVACNAEGPVTSATFDFEGPSAAIQLSEPVGTWTAISFLHPEEQPAP